MLTKPADNQYQKLTHHDRQPVEEENASTSAGIT